MSLVAEGRLTSRDCELHSGDRLTQAEFHRLYENTAEDFRAELIGGIVYVASPLRLPHGRYSGKLSTLLGHYEAATPGVEFLDNATTILGEFSEPQPDLSLRILTEFGGQSAQTDTEYLSGAPELIVEVAHSSRAVDLHAKKGDYEEAGVREYIVLCVAQQEILRFCLREGKLVEVPADGDGVLRSQVFPGLWIDAAAVLAKDSARALTTLQTGLSTREHGEFVRLLQTRRRPDATPGG